MAATQAARTWQQINAASAGHGPALRMISYNVLADKYAGAHTYCPAEFLAWEYRSPALLQQLESYAADVVCLQELQADVFEGVWQPWMQQRGYHSLHNPRPPAAGSSITGPQDGVSLHFRSAQFKLLRSQSVRFADHAEALLPRHCCSRHARSGSPQQKQSAFMRALQQREEGAVMALLQHQPTQQQLVVCSTHLHWNPQVPDIKLAQAAILCHCLSAFVQQPGQQQQQQQPPEQQQRHVSSMPVIIGGDFNSVWRKYSSDAWDQLPPGVDSLMSGVYELLSGQEVSPSHQDHPTHRQHCRDCRSRSRSPGAGSSSSKSGGSSKQRSRSGSPSGQQQHQQGFLDGFTFTTSGLQLQSSHFAVHQREPTLTTRTSSFSGCLDYIWVSKQGLQVTGTLRMPYSEPAGPPGGPEGVSAAAMGACPNAAQPSDHLAVGCEVALLV